MIKNNRLNPTQIYMLRFISSRDIVELDTYCHWDQRPLIGLYRRGLITLNADYGLLTTEDGEDLLAASKEVRTRQNPEDPTVAVYQSHHKVRVRRLRLVS